MEQFFMWDEQNSYLWLHSNS